MERPITHDHMTSLRLPKDWDDFIKKFADKWSATPAFVYRAAIKDFIKRQGGSA